MTKHYRWNDDNIKEMLMELPEMKDTRSRDEVWQSIHLHKKKKRKQWIVPTVAALASLFFIISFVQSRDQNQDTALQFDEASLLEESSAKEEALDMAPFSSGKDLNTVIDEEPLVIYNNQQQIVTIGFLEKNRNVIVPISFIGNDVEPIENQMQGFLNDFNGEVYGFQPSIFQSMEIESVNDTVTLEIDEEDSSHLPKDRTTFQELMRETFRWKNFDKIKLYTNNEPGIELSSGKLFEIEIDKLLKKAYFLLPLNERSFLVPTKKSYQSVDEAFHAMRNGDGQVNDSLIPTILQPFLIEKVEKDGNLLTVSFKNEENYVDEKRVTIMIEAMLMTAKEFGFEYVEFKGLEDLMIQKYDLRNPIEVPYSPNPLYVYN